MRDVAVTIVVVVIQICWSDGFGNRIIVIFDDQWRLKICWRRSTHHWFVGVDSLGL